MDKNKSLLSIFCLLLPLFLLLFSSKTTLFFIDLTAPQKGTINFLNNDGELTLNYTSPELSHLNDVKKVMHGAGYFFYGILLVLTLILTYYRKNKEQTIKLLKYGGLTTIIFVLVVLLFVLINFNLMFNLFHQIFFPQGNWIFAGDSLLIQTFPLGFFVKVSWIVFMGTLILGIAFALFPKLLEKFYKEREIIKKRT